MRAMTRACHVEWGKCVYYYGNNPCILPTPYPPFPRSCGIKDLGGSPCQVFGSKGLAGKVFKNQRLNLSKSSENGFGAVSRLVRVDRRTLKLPQSDLYRHALRGLSQWISIAVGGRKITETQ